MPCQANGRATEISGRGSRRRVTRRNGHAGSRKGERKAVCFFLAFLLQKCDKRSEFITKKGLKGRFLLWGKTAQNSCKTLLMVWEKYRGDKLRRF